MACKCKAEIEAKLLEHCRAQQPDHTSISATLEGYGYTLGATSVGYRPFMTARIESQRPVKGGGTRKAAKRINMFFSYCPFCGAGLRAEEHGNASTETTTEVPA